MMHTNPQTIAPTDAERARWATMASAAYVYGYKQTGHRYRMAVSMRGPMPLAEYDKLMEDYRRWLIDNVFPVEA